MLVFLGASEGEANRALTPPEAAFSARESGKTDFLLVCIAESLSIVARDLRDFPEETSEYARLSPTVCYRLSGFPSCARTVRKYIQGSLGTKILLPALRFEVGAISRAYSACVRLPRRTGGNRRRARRSREPLPYFANKIPVPARRESG